MAMGGERQGGVYLDVGQIEVGMPLGHVASVFVPRHQPDGDLAAPLDDMLVGDHQPALVDNETRAGAGIRDNLNHAGQSVLRHICNGQAGRQRLVKNRLNI